MPNSEFSTDFGFRRGSEASLNRTAIKDGTFNLCLDTGNLFIDIDGQRISTRDITIVETEAQIRAIADPNPRIYFAKDTDNFLIFDIPTLSWRLAGAEHATYSEKAGADANGNIFEDFYETIENSNSKISDVNDTLSELREIIAQINSFEIRVLESEDDLPLEGEEHVIYFVPNENEEGNTQFDEYVWLSDEEYYEKIGITKPDLADYYNKTSVDDLLANMQSDLEGQISGVQDNVDTLGGTVETLAGYISSNTSNIGSLNTAVSNNKIASEQADNNLQTAINGVKGGSEVDTTELNLTTLDEKDAAIIGDDSIDLDDINLAALAQKDADIIGDDTLDLTETNLNSLQTTANDHEDRIAYIEEHGSGSDELQEQIDAIKGDEELDTSVTNLKSLKEAIDLISDPSGGSIADLVGRVGANENNIAALDDRADALESDVSDLKDDSADYKAYKISNDANITDVQTVLQGNITSVSNDLSDHIDASAATDADLQDQITSLETTVEGLGRFRCVIVNDVTDLPAEGTNGTLYFIPTGEEDRYNQYIWIESEETYELIGLTTIDLEDYYTKSEVDTIVANVLSSIGYSQNWVSVNGKGDAVVDFGLD